MLNTLYYTRTSMSILFSKKVKKFLKAPKTPKNQGIKVYEGKIKMA